jgi:hypothetical protein
MFCTIPDSMVQISGNFIEVYISGFWPLFKTCPLQFALSDQSTKSQPASSFSTWDS